MDLELIKTYVTGAHIYKEDRYTRFVGFDDCEHCHGQGYTEDSSRWSYRTRREQCKACALKHGNPEFMDTKSMIKDLERQAARMLADLGVKVNASGHLDSDQAAAVELVQFSEVGRQYRALLRNVWGGWIEPAEVIA